jgi:hypothetical protein
MINVICPGSSSQAGAIVASALGRSCSASQVRQASISQLAACEGRSEPDCWVLLDPLDAWVDAIIKAIAEPYGKVIVFGKLPPALALHLGVEVRPLDAELVQAARCLPAKSKQFSQSAAAVHYTGALGDRESPMSRRPFLRYDFTDEWNNLGYGAITADASIWSLSQIAVVSGPQCLAHVVIENEPVSAYVAVWDTPQFSLLWFNRAVGPVDSQEWCLVEHFIANYRHAELPCWPVLSEVPYGYASAVTMRLDCDEDVESARSLWDTYQELGVPFSLALHAQVLADPVHHALPKEVLANGGALLSHTATHAPNWGGSYAAAYVEASSSAASIYSATAHRVKYAVSPFHQTPTYARAALADAGYAGCIGGIIRNDPDFLIARAGIPPGSAEGFIGHSQQCMLHGDCMLAGSDPLKIFKQAFDLARKSKTFFGFLDHPFSPRYQYGWATEAQRIQIHRDFLAYLRGHEAVLFANENDAMDFLSYRAAVQVEGEAGHFHIKAPLDAAPWPLAVEYGGATHVLGSKELRL